MSLPGLYFDDDSSAKIVVSGIAAAGLEAVPSRLASMFGRPDIEHLRFAASVGLPLVTSNQRDFARIHAAMMAVVEHHAGIVIVTQQRYSAGEIIRRLLRLAESASLETMRDTVEFLSDWGDDREQR